MQEDKHLKALLKQWAVENPSADFTSRVMQRVTPAYTFNTPPTPLLKQKVPQLLFSIFILICIALLALSFIMPAASLPVQFTVKLPVINFSQGFSFLIAFWVVMLFNLAFKKLLSRSSYNQ